MADLIRRASTTPKFAPKPGENGAKIESFPVFCLVRLDRIAGGLLKTGRNFGFHSFLAALTVTRNIEKKLTSQFPLKISGGQLQEINFSIAPDFHTSLTLLSSSVISSPDKVLSNKPELNPFKSYQTFT